MSQPFKLYRLQQLDSQLDRDKTRLAEIVAALSEDEVLRSAHQAVEKAAQALQTAQKSLRRAEEEVQQQRMKIEQTEATLYGGKVRNPKELQDLQKEAAALKRYRSVLEDRQLEEMLAVEEAETVQESTQKELKAIQEQIAGQQQVLIEEQAGLNKEVNRLEAERQAAVSGIPPADLNLYNTLRKTRRGVAVAKVSDRACSACGSTLNAALLHAARSPNQITRCDTCGRILYAG